MGLVAVEEEEEELPGWCCAALATPAAALYSPLVVVAHTVVLPLVLLLLVPTVGTAAGVVTEVFPEARGEVSRECASRQSVLMLNVRATPNPAVKNSEIIYKNDDKTFLVQLRHKAV